ncbi:MAG: hypothetical protein ACFCD0_04780 [Gemmataceae bacterium]
MAKSTISLQTITVADPCQVPWDTMQGDNTVRFCSQCQRHVYNLSEMSRPQAERLIEETEGKLCVRFYRRPDGTFLTRRCPRSVRAFGVFLVRLIGAGLATLLLLFGVSLAYSIRSSQTQPPPQNNPDRPAQHISHFFRKITDWFRPHNDEMIMGKICPPHPPKAIPPGLPKKSK